MRIIFDLLKEDFKLEEGKIVDLVKENNSVNLYVEGILTGQTQDYSEDLFVRRNNFKGIIKGIYTNAVEVMVVRYADLHRHSGYSLLDGAIRIKDMVEATEYAGALTDHGNMFGFLQYYKEMKAQGKKPIIGFEAYVETIDGKKEQNHLVLLAKNEQGFKNLIKLTSYAYDNFYIKPHVSIENLKKYKEGLICTSACIGGEIQQYLLNDNYEKAKEVALFYKQLFGEDFYIEIQRHNFEEEKKVERELLKLAKELDIKVIATTDAHYLKKEDAQIHEILLCIQTGKTLDEDHWTFPGEGYYIHTSEEMEEKFKDIPEALDNTLEIVEKINLELDLETRYMPKFEIPKEFNNEEEYFEYLCRKGYEERFKNTEKYNDKIYKERFEYELEMIKKMGFCGYFLIVQDYINWAKERGILVGPGRGSCVGSLVAYCLKITDVDPIPYNLLFERFLNPERISMPDIDTDFQDDRRDEVIEYVRNKYGYNSVSKIITFGTLSAKAVVKDVARVLGYDFNFSNQLTKYIPPKITLKKALEESIEFKNLYDTDEDVRKIINIAMKLEGLQRHNSQHACGIIISPSAVEDYIPTVKIENEEGIKETTSQLVMTEVEEMGLLKMDFLGLRTMTVIKNTIDLVYKTKGIKIDLNNIKFEPKVFKYIAEKNTLGVFQLESEGMTEFISKLYQDVTDKSNGDELFERLIAGISLYRPGPMDSIPEYLNNMLNPENIEYKIPALKEILAPTYGIIVYQEQVMQIVQKLAGYTLGRADLVRKAMGKKKEDIMVKEKDVFINGLLDEEGNVIIPGCIRNGIKKEDAEEIWDKMAEFAKYAFNKSHATAYALISYWTAWLNYHYNLEFMVALLNSVINNNEKLKSYVEEITSRGFKILPPDINKSKEYFSIDGNSIRFGLKAIKGLGKTSDLIINERTIRGEFKSYQDFVERMIINQKIDKSNIEALIYVGALDSFEGTRKAKISILDKLIKISNVKKKENQNNQITLFDVFKDLKQVEEIKMPQIEEFERSLKLSLEKEYSGMYITEHPLDCYKDILRIEEVINIKDVIRIENFENYDEDDEFNDGFNIITNNNYVNGKIKLAGIVKDFKIFYSKKNNNPIYSFVIEDKTGQIKAVMFSKEVEKYSGKIKNGELFIFYGQINSSDFGTQMIVENIIELNNYFSNIPQAVGIEIVNKEEIKILNKILTNIKDGNIKVYVKINNKKQVYNRTIKYDFIAFKKMQDIFGERFKLIYNLPMQKIS